MKKILVLVKNDYITFSTYTREIDEQNLNNTNVINTKNLKFTEEYIIENLELISAFFNLIILKTKISKAIINNMEIAETILILLKHLESINNVYFKEDKELNYTLSSLLLENNHLIKIDCYNMPEIMFYRFKKDEVETRCKILFTSKFMDYNNITTYSKLYNKDKIIIDEYLNPDDVDDLIYFFKSNRGLKKIELKRYTRNNLMWILKQLEKNNFRKVTIIICENSKTTNLILNDISLFTKFSKQYKVNIKVKYSKEYTQKYKVKELNIVMFRYIVISIIILSILFFGLYKFLEMKNKKNIDKNITTINDVVNEAVDNSGVIGSEEPVEKNGYVSPYYTKYTEAYNELIKLNSDTIGWLRVNNTKIDYPVVQTRDNDYYLNNSFDKTSNIAGWLFADYRNDMDNISKNTIIYGHSMLKNGLMFETLKNVLKESWNTQQSNLNIYFSIKDKNINWQIFSIYTIENTNDYLITDFSSDSSFEKYVQMIQERSIKNFNTEVNSDNKILTLSTCYKDSNHRLVVHAKMVN